MTIKSFFQSIFVKTPVAPTEPAYQLSPEEVDLVHLFIDDVKQYRDQVEALYLKHIRNGKNCVEMLYLSECFNVSPDFRLAAMYRRQVIERRA